MRTPTAFRRQRGFSLIELLIVVAVIGIIASIAVPHFIASRQAAYAASAIRSLRLIHSAEVSYRATNGVYGDLIALGNADFINDPLLRGGRKSGYDFNVTPDSGDASADYTADATPAYLPGSLQHYFVDSTGVIRFEVGAPASSSSSPIN